MFQLTPQERHALIWLLVIFCLGTVISMALKKDARVLQWVKTVHHAHDPFPLDLNASSAEQLKTVPGIGLKTAQRIVDYRTKQGPFTSVDDLHKVKGFAKKNFDKIAPLLVVHTSP